MKRYYSNLLRVSVLMLAAVMIFTLAGCKGKEGGMTVKDMSANEKTFAYPELEWGSDPDTVKKALGFELVSDGQPMPDENGDTYISMNGQPVTLEGIEGDTIYQFANDHLWATGMNFMYGEGKDGAKDFEKILSAAKEAYGEPTSSNEIGPDNEAFPGTGFSENVWERVDDNGVTSRLMITCATKDDKVDNFMVNLSQFPIPESYLGGDK